MKTAALFFVLLFVFSLGALASKPKHRVECEAKTAAGNKRIDVVCKSTQALSPGDVINIEININSNPNHPPEAV